MKIEYLFLFALFACLILALWRLFYWKMQAALLKEKLQTLENQETRLKETFQTLSLTALQENNASFLNLARGSFEMLQHEATKTFSEKERFITEIVAPVKETLGKLDEGLRLLEKERRGEQIALKAQVDQLLTAKKELSTETGKLVQALRSPIARGRWGEIQLRRVVEMAGMLNRCDFYEQARSEGGDGGTKEGAFRPDLIVRLPGDRIVIIDAKVPLEAYLEALEFPGTEIAESKLKEHAKAVRNHVQLLGRKNYHQQFSQTPEFVVLFLPAETFFSAALQYDPGLIEVGVEQGVIIATPTTLIALLKSVAYGWKQEHLSRHAEEVSALGHELYKRLVDMSAHFSKMGRALSSAVEAYNGGIGSLEARVLVSARKFQEMGAAASHLELEAPDLIEKGIREGSWKEE